MGGVTTDYGVRRLADPRGEESQVYKAPKLHVQRSLGRRLAAERFCSRFGEPGVAKT